MLKTVRVRWNRAGQCGAVCGDPVSWVEPCPGTVLFNDHTMECGCDKVLGILPENPSNREEGPEWTGMLRPGGYIRNTPKELVPSTGPECTADKAMPKAVRVSRGSTKPSSQMREVAK